MQDDDRPACGSCQDSKHPDEVVRGACPSWCLQCPPHAPALTLTQFPRPRTLPAPGQTKSCPDATSSAVHAPSVSPTPGPHHQLLAPWASSTKAQIQLHSALYRPTWVSRPSSPKAQGQHSQGAPAGNASTQQLHEGPTRGVGLAPQDSPQARVLRVFQARLL